MRLAFLGTPPAAVVALEALVAAGHEVTIVVSRADARRGRRGPPSPSPVKVAALARGIPVAEDAAAVVDSGAELGVVVAFGRLIPARILDAVPMVNLHFSLLPRWRGAAPVERAILAGDPTTGVCLMAVAEGLDTGGVYRRFETPIGDDETASELTARLARSGSEMLVAALAEGLGAPVPQGGPATYADKVTTEDRQILWPGPALQVSRVVRIGRAWTTFRGRRLLVLSGQPVSGAAAYEPAVLEPPRLEPPRLEPAGLQPGELGTWDERAVVGTGGGVFALGEVQPEGRGAVPAAEWLRGARPQPGERLGAEAGAPAGSPESPGSRG